jgi:hypothetical protein
MKSVQPCAGLHGTWMSGLHNAVYVLSGRRTRQVRAASTLIGPLWQGLYPMGRWLWFRCQSVVGVYIMCLVRVIPGLREGLMGHRIRVMARPADCRARSAGSASGAPLVGSDTHTFDKKKTPYLVRERARVYVYLVVHKFSLSSERQLRRACLYVLGCGPLGTEERNEPGPRRRRVNAEAPLSSANVVATTRGSAGQEHARCE